MNGQVLTMNRCVLVCIALASTGAFAQTTHNVTTEPELQTANGIVVSGDTISLAAGTYVLTTPVVLVSGVTYQGASALTTTIDGSGSMRLFEAAGTGVPDSGQTGWLIDSLSLTNGHSTSASAVDESGGVIVLRNGASGTISNCLISDSAADDTGGFASIDNEDAGAARTTLTVTDCQITNCTTTPGIGDDGGAVKMDGNSSFIMDRTMVTECVAADVGAVMKTGDSTGPETTLRNCIFYDNGHPGQEQLFELRANATVVNCTFVGNNIASDYILELRSPETGKPHTLVNSVFAENTQTNIDPMDPEDDPLVLFVTDGNDDGVISNNLFWDNVSEEGPDVMIEALGGDRDAIGESGNIEGDPQFAGAMDFHLTEFSAAVDAGTNASALGVTDDIEGNARPDGLAYDIGAYESEFVGGGPPFVGTPAVSAFGLGLLAAASGLAALRSIGRRKREF